MDTTPNLTTLTFEEYLEYCAQQQLELKKKFEERMQEHEIAQWENEGGK